MKRIVYILTILLFTLNIKIFCMRKRNKFPEITIHTDKNGDILSYKNKIPQPVLRPTYIENTTSDSDTTQISENSSDSSDDITEINPSSGDIIDYENTSDYSSTSNTSDTSYISDTSDSSDQYSLDKYKAKKSKKIKSIKSIEKKHFKTRSIPIIKPKKSNHTLLELFKLVSLPIFIPCLLTKCICGETCYKNCTQQYLLCTLFLCCCPCLTVTELSRGDL